MSDVQPVAGHWGRHSPLIGRPAAGPPPDISAFLSPQTPPAPQAPLPPGALTSDPNGPIGGFMPGFHSSLVGTPAPMLPGPAAPSAPAPAAPRDGSAAPTPPAVSPPQPGRGDLTPGQQSIWDVIRLTLHEYQLDTPDVLDWAKQQIINNASASSIELDLYDPTTVPGKIVDQRMPGIRLRRQNGLTPISIADYQTYRRTYHQLLSSYGIPQGVFDSDQYVGNQIGNDRGLTEIKSDLDIANQLVNQEPPETLAEMERLYGIGTGGLIAHYLDPTAAAPVLQRQAQSAIASGTAARAGYGGLTQQQAEGLAALGTSQTQMEQGFSQLRQQQQIFQTLPGEAGNNITRDEQLAAAFGSSGGAQQRIAQRVAARKAAFQDGGGVATDRSGIIGAGALPGA